MVRLNVFSDSDASALFELAEFPIVIGRNRDASLCLEKDGIWERHLEIVLQMPEGFILNVNPSAIASVNGEPVQRHPLRNGDVIQIGRSRIRFSLGGTRQIDLRPREFLTWLGLAALCAAQIILIYYFLR